MKDIRCNHCGREFCQRDYDANISVRWSHDTQTNQADQAELCCECLEALVARYMEETSMTTTHDNRTICAECGKEFENTHAYQIRISGNVPKIEAAWDRQLCRDCFDDRAEKFIKACIIKPKIVPWINSEMCAWITDTEKKVNAHA